MGAIFYGSGNCFTNSVFGVMAVLITNTFANKRGYDKINSKIGDVGDNTLSRQHKDIIENIKLVETNIKG